MTDPQHDPDRPANDEQPQREWASRIGKLRAEVEAQIARTPTGRARNDLTDANIHLMAAVHALGDYDLHVNAPASMEHVGRRPAPARCTCGAMPGADPQCKVHGG